MKTIKILSGAASGWFAVAAVFLTGLLLSGCYTVLKNSSDYYSEFDTSDKKKEITRDTLIVQNEWETEDFADSADYTEEEYIDESAGSKTVIINRYYNDPWFTWNNYYPYYYPHYGWRVTIGWGAWPVYYDPYWYNPYWHSGYYWGWCCSPGYYDPWYPPRWSGGGSWGYSHYQRRDYGMRRYQLNPVTSGGSGVFMGTGSRATTTGAVQTSGNSLGGRTYRDANATATGSREGSARDETARSDNKRKSRSNEKIKSGRGGTKVKSGKNEGRRYRDNDSGKKNDNSSKGTRTERSSGSNKGTQTRDANSSGGSRGGRDAGSSGGGGRGGRDMNSGSSGGGRSGGSSGSSSGGSSSSGNSGRPTRR